MLANTAVRIGILYPLSVFEKCGKNMGKHFGKEGNR